MKSSAYPLLPILNKCAINDKTNKRMKTKKRILAISVNAPARPPNPKKPTITAIMAQATA